MAKVESAAETHRGLDPVNRVQARYCDVRVQLDNGESLTAYAKILDLDPKRQNHNEVKTCWDGKYWANTSFTCADYAKAPGRK